MSSALLWLTKAASLPRAAFSTSFSAEDMVLLDLLHRHRLTIDVFTLDTGRLHDETYDLMHRVEGRYGRIFEVFFPQTEAVQGLVSRQGINGFFQSVEQRKACCHVRKVEPLRRALAGRGAWVTGQRAVQSVTRQRLEPVERDEALGLDKFNPLHDWSDADVWAYVKSRGIPTNALHERSYPSIGCAPCTRAISAGEDIRAGRWWWEQAQHRECGLHNRPPFARPSRETAETSA